MVQFIHVIKDPEGLHARLVAGVAAEARRWKSSCVVSCDSAHADATDPMALLRLDAHCGDELTIIVSGPDEEAAAMALQQVFAF